jgi:hypothetical protein
MHSIIASFVGLGKPFPYKENAIYTLITAPEVYNWDCDVNSPQPAPYGGYHFSYNASIDNLTVLLNHAYVITTGNASKVVSLSSLIF